jgi:polyphosphate kinase 2
VSKSSISENIYEADLRLLQIELVKLQRHLSNKGKRLLVIIEGRDTAGKDGSIKSIIENLNPKDRRVVVLHKPSPREIDEWYFQRYIAELPTTGEIVIFNRSWYNRAGVEKVMGFCTTEQYDQFMATVNELEFMLVKSGLHLMKYYLDITKEEQASRLRDRANDPLKQWKISPIDKKVQTMWSEYSDARNKMLKRTSSSHAPWTVIVANDKKVAHLNLIADLLLRVNYPNKDKKILKIDPNIVLTWPTNSKMLPKLSK